MSVNNTQSQKQNTQSSSPAQGQAAMSNKGVVSNFNALFRAPVSYSMSGDALNKFYEAFDECLKKIQNVLVGNYKLLALDTSDVSGAVQLVVLYSEQAGHVVFNSFIIESTLRGALQDRVYKGGYGQADTHIPTFVGDLYTAEMSGYVVTQLSKVVNVDPQYVHDAGAVAIYSELNPESDHHIHIMLWRATNSIQDIFNSQDDTSPRLNLANFKAAKFSGRMDFSPAQGETSSGLPIRRDVVLSVTMSDSNHDNHDPAALTQNVAQLAQVGGYLDMRFTGPRPYNYQQMMNSNQMILPTQVYQPTLFITDTNTLANQINLEMQLFALSEFTQLSRGHLKRWVNMLRPRYGSNPEVASLRNFRGFQHEVGAEIVQDPDSPNFNLLEEVNKIAHPTLAHVLVCSTTGDLSWIHTTFRMAAAGDAEAIMAIRNAADNLCNGHFSAFFPEGTAIAQIENDRIIQGYWKSNTEMRALADVDQLAMYNLCGENDMATVNAFTDTFNPSKGQVHERVAKRIEILKTVFQGNIRMTGLDIPVVINPVFMAALANGIQKAGVSVVYDDNAALLGSNDRTNYSLINFGMDPSSLHMNMSMPMANGLQANWFSGNRFGVFGG